jgi:ABC-type antimicrobial peptide transport system permease subunit
MTDGMFGDLMAFPKGANRIVVRAPAGVSLEAATAAVTAIAPESAVRNWKQLNPFVAQMLDAMQVQMKVLYFILYVAVGILVLNAMLMALFERIREFGVLKAIGYGPGQVFVMMVLEGLFQATVATVVGSLLAIPFMVYLANTGFDIGALGGVSMIGMTVPTVWHGVYTAEVVRVPILMLFFIVFGAVLYPAIKAAWISPVEAMHHQ